MTAPAPSPREPDGSSGVFDAAGSVLTHAKIFGALVLCACGSVAASWIAGFFLQHYSFGSAVFGCVALLIPWGLWHVFPVYGRRHGWRWRWYCLPALVHAAVTFWNLLLFTLFIMLDHEAEDWHQPALIVAAGFASVLLVHGGLIAAGKAPRSFAAPSLGALAGVVVFLVLAGAYWLAWEWGSVR